MKLEIPPIRRVITRMLPMPATFNGRTKTIETWVKAHRRSMARNRRMAVGPRKDDLAVLRLFLRELLIRAISGEGGQRIGDALDRITCLRDLRGKIYRDILKESYYRWGVAAGVPVMEAVVRHFRDEREWDWKSYFDEAEASCTDNFPQDALLQIPHVKHKVRNLALSNFIPLYPAFDLHVIRVASRIGLIAHGWRLTGDPAVEFGTNATDEKNVLLWHRLFLHLSIKTGGEFSPVDLDRIFWHFGRTLCGARTDCGHCPVQRYCLTGQRRG